MIPCPLQPPSPLPLSSTGSTQPVAAVNLAVTRRRATIAGSSATSSTTGLSIRVRLGRKKFGTICPTSPQAETSPPPRRTRPSTPFCFFSLGVLGAERGAASDVDRAEEPERRPQKRGHQTAPPLPVGRAEGGRSASRRDRHHQVGRLSHAPPFVCNLPPRAGHRPPNGPRTPWPQDLRTTQVYTHALQDGPAATLQSRISTSTLSERLGNALHSMPSRVR